MTIRDTAAALARALVGGDQGRRVDDPIVRAVTEGRVPGEGYSSCADHPHALRYLVGLRDRVNRREAGSYQAGTRTMAWLCEPGRVGAKFGHPCAVVPRATTRLEPGDTIILDVGHSARTHTCIVLDHGATELVTADYGQHPMKGQRPEHIACRVVRRPLKVQGGRLWAGDRPIDSVLPLEAELAWAEREGTLRPAKTLEEWLAAHGTGAQPQSSAPLASATPRPVPVDTRASTGAGLPASRILGVDVSAHQTPGSVNWRLLRELGFSFAYIRGVKMGRELDVHAVEHVARAREAGFAVGLYLFFDPRHEDTKQLTLAIDAHGACGMHPGDLAPALDVESITGGPTAIPAWSEPAHFILRGLRDEYGDVLRYHNVRDWFLMGRPSQLEGFDLWLADYAPPADLPCVCWQHKSATIPGYGSQVLDQNVAMGPLPTIGGRAVPVVVEPSTLPDEIALPWVRWDHAEHNRLRNAAEARKTDRGEYD